MFQIQVNGNLLLTQHKHCPMGLFSCDYEHFHVVQNISHAYLDRGLMNIIICKKKYPRMHSSPFVEEN